MEKEVRFPADVSSNQSIEHPTIALNWLVNSYDLPRSIDFEILTNHD
jgi:hypothetical protein